MSLRRSIGVLALVAAAALPFTASPAHAADTGTVVPCDGGDSEQYLPGSECDRLITDGRAMGCTVDWSNAPVGDNADTLTVACPKPVASATIVNAKDVTKDVGKKGKCTVARDAVSGHLRIAGKYFKAGGVMMTTSFCYDGKTVYKAGTRDEPHHATFENPQVMSTPFITCTYTGSLDNDFSYGYTDDTKTVFYTTGTVGFNCTGPALVLGVTVGPAQVGVQINQGNVYLTVTQYVRNDGRVSTIMGGRK